MTKAMQVSWASVLGKYTGDTGSEEEPRARIYAMERTWGWILLGYTPHWSLAHLGYICPTAKGSGPPQLGLVSAGSGCTLEREPEHRVLTPCEGTATFHIARRHSGFQVTADGILGIRVKEGEVLLCSITLSPIQAQLVTGQPRATTTKVARETKCPAQASAASLAPNPSFTQRRHIALAHPGRLLS